MGFDYGRSNDVKWNPEFTMTSYDSLYRALINDRKYGGEFSIFLENKYGTSFMDTLSNNSIIDLLNNN